VNVIPRITVAVWWPRKVVRVSIAVNSAAMRVVTLAIARMKRQKNSDVTPNLISDVFQ
jgi:hypothetical protein